MVRARTSGGGVGSNEPWSEICGLYTLLDGWTGLLGNIARNRALMFGEGAADLVGLGAGLGVGRSSIGRAGAGLDWVPGPF